MVKVRVRERTSEAVVVRCDEAEHLVEILKVFKDSILEHRVKLVLNTRKQRCLLVLVNAELLPASMPVQCLQVQESEVVNDLAHPCVHLRLAQVVIHGQRLVTGHLASHRLKPWRTTLKSNILCLNLTSALTFWGKP